jgi:hypothetical protein
MLSVNVQSGFAQERCRKSQVRSYPCVPYLFVSWRFTFHRLKYSLMYCILSVILVCKRSNL